MQENKEKIDKGLLIRHINGISSSEDENIILQWMDNTVKEPELCEESLQFWNRVNPDQDIQDYNEDHILDRIHHKIKIEEEIFLIKNKPKIRFISYLTRIAAILVIPLLISSFLFYFQNRTFRNAVSWSEIHAPYGTRTDFYLPDGSTGRLNGGSSLKFPTRFTGKARDVKLNGEAYFEVVSNQRMPFIVSTKNIDVKVTGTSFNIMAYTDERKTEVILKNGKVEVYKKKDGILESMGVLKPDESFIYDTLTESGKVKSINIANRLSWVDDKLTFKYEPFEEVILRLNRWYNVNIVIKDKSIDSYIYYGTFQNETLEEVLKLLQYTSPIRYKVFERERKQDGTFEKRKIEIYSRN